MGMAICPKCGLTRTWCRRDADPGCTCQKNKHTIEFFRDENFSEAIKDAKEVFEETKPKRRKRNEIPIDDEVGEILPVEDINEFDELKESIDDDEQNEKIF